MSDRTPDLLKQIEELIEHLRQCGGPMFRRCEVLLRAAAHALAEREAERSSKDNAGLVSQGEGCSYRLDASAQPGSVEGEQNGVLHHVRDSKVDRLAVPSMQGDEQSSGPIVVGAIMSTTDPDRPPSATCATANAPHAAQASEEVERLQAALTTEQAAHRDTQAQLAGVRDESERRFQALARAEAERDRYHRNQQALTDLNSRIWAVIPGDHDETSIVDIVRDIVAERDRLAEALTEARLVWEALRSTISGHVTWKHRMDMSVAAPRADREDQP